MSSQSSLFSSFNLQQWPNLVNLPKTGFTFSYAGWMADTEYRSYSRDNGPIRSKRQDVDADSAQRLTALALNLHQPGASVNNEGVTSGGAVMTLRICLLSMLMSVLGRASQIERVQTTQPTAEQTQEEQAKKPALLESGAIGDDWQCRFFGLFFLCLLRRRLSGLYTLDLARTPEN